MALCDLQCKWGALSVVITPLNFNYKPNFSHKPNHRHKNSELYAKITLSRLYTQWGAPSVGYYSEK